MARKSLFSIAVVGTLTLTGQFICLPVFAENPAEIRIVEVVDDGSGGYKAWEDITGAMPGMTYSAIPRVKNDGSVALAIKVCLSGTVTNAANESVPLPANTFGIDINSNWTLDVDGAVNPEDPAAGNCYTYNSSLEPGALTEPLFTEVTLSTALENEYQGAKFGLHLDAYSKGDESSEPVAPTSPDTGTIRNNEVTAALVIPYVLGVAALMVLAIHLIRSFLVKK